MEATKKPARSGYFGSCRTNPPSFCRLILIVLILLAGWQVIPFWQGHTFVQKVFNALRWEEIQAAKAQLQPFSLGWEDYNDTTAWVLSLPQSQDRRDHITKQLIAAGVPFEIIDAVYGQHELDELEVAFAESSGRISRFIARDKHMRAKVGCDLSHLRLLHRMLGLGSELALIFEDDAEIPQDFRQQLYHAMNALPDDWDLLQLNSCNPKVSRKPVRANLHITFESSCTLAYVCRRSFALKVLDAVARAKLGKDIDDFYGDLTSSGKIAAYMTMPFIVERSELAANSTIQIYG